MNASGCTANDWLRITIGPEGCVAGFQMDQPDQNLVACLAQQLGQIRCSCLGTNVNVDIFLGVGHTGTTDGVQCYDTSDDNNPVAGDN
jgi:hypothetical protein